MDFFYQGKKISLNIIKTRWEREIRMFSLRFPGLAYMEVPKDKYSRGSEEVMRQVLLGISSDRERV